MFLVAEEKQERDECTYETSSVLALFSESILQWKSDDIEHVQSIATDQSLRHDTDEWVRLRISIESN